MADPEPIATIAPDVVDAWRRAQQRADDGIGSAHQPRPPLEAVEPVRGPAPLPRRFAGATLASLEGEAADLADEWADTGMSASVLLLGAVGVGKTHTACALARAAWQAGSGVQFSPVVELLDQLRPGGPDGALERAITVDVLVLDDLGGERPTDWTGERLYALVNRRWLEQRPTIVTSNLAPIELEQAVGPRVFSRLYHDAIRLQIGGDDRRRTAATT